MALDKNGQTLARHLAAGVGGWWQHLAAMRRQSHAREDVARKEMADLAVALGFRVELNASPAIWKPKVRIDLALLRPRASGWLGAIELKWLSKANNIASARRDIVQDVVRVSLMDIAAGGPRFVVLAAPDRIVQALFETEGRTATTDDEQDVFSDLLSHEENNPLREIRRDDVESAFAEFEDRVPEVHRGYITGGFRTALVATSHAHLCGHDVGHVHVWQVECRFTGPR